MISLVNQAAVHWWSWMSPMFIQASALIVAVGMVDLLLRRWSWPEVRHALWLLVLVKLILPPSLSSPTSIANLFPETVSAERAIVPPVTSSKSLGIPTAVPTAYSRVPSPGASRETGLLPSSTTSHPIPTRQSLSWKAWLMVSWFVVVAFLGSWALFRLRNLRRDFVNRDGRNSAPPGFTEALRAAAIQLGLRRTPPVVFVDAVQSPAVFGMLRPVLVMPSSWRGRPADAALRHILLHELAHIRRGDLLIHSLFLALQICYWFNPLLLVVRRRLHHLRELCCDATVAGLLKDETPEYRRTLLQAAESLVRPLPPNGLGLLGLLERPGNLLERLRRLEGEVWRHSRLRFFTVAATAMVTIAAVLPMKQTPHRPSKPASRFPGTHLLFVRHDNSDSATLVLGQITPDGFKEQNLVTRFMRSARPLGVMQGRAYARIDDDVLCIDLNTSQSTTVATKLDCCAYADSHLVYPVGDSTIREYDCRTQSSRDITLPSGLIATERTSEMPWALSPDARHLAFFKNAQSNTNRGPAIVSQLMVTDLANGKVNPVGPPVQFSVGPYASRGPEGPPVTWLNAGTVAYVRTQAPSRETSNTAVPLGEYLDGLTNTVNHLVVADIESGRVEDLAPLPGRFPKMRIQMLEPKPFAPAAITLNYGAPDEMSFSVDLKQRRLVPSQTIGKDLVLRRSPSGHQLLADDKVIYEAGRYIYAAASPDLKSVVWTAASDPPVHELFLYHAKSGVRTLRKLSGGWFGSEIVWVDPGELNSGETRQNGRDPVTSVDKTVSDARETSAEKVTIAGRVTSETGDPLANCTVELAKPVYPTEGFVLSDGFPMAKLTEQQTDAHGDFRFADLPGNLPEFEVKALHPDYDGTKTRVVILPPRKEFTVDMRLAPGQTVHGTVVNSDNKPVDGVRITVYQSPQTKEAFTNQKGEFELRGVLPRPDGKIHCDVWKQSYQAQEDVVAQADGWRISLKKFDDPTFSGTARFADGSPVASGKIEFFPASGGPSPSFASPLATTIKDGRFEGRLDRSGQSTGTAWIKTTYRRAEAGGESIFEPYRWRGEFQNLRMGNHDLSVVFENRGRIEVQVDTAGLKQQPKSPLEITISLSVQDQSAPIIFDDIAGHASVGPGSGRAVFGNLTRGQYTVRISSPDGPSWNQWSRTVQIPAGSDTWTTSVEFLLQDQQLGNVRGHLRMTDNKPIPSECRAWLRIPFGSAYPLSLSENTIQADHLPEGEYSLTIEGKSVLRSERSFVVRRGETTDLGETVLAYQGTESGWVEGRVLFDDGTPALGATILEQFVVGGSQSIVVAYDGSYRVQLHEDARMVGVDLRGVPRWPRRSLLDAKAQTSLAMMWQDCLWAPVSMKPGKTIQRDIIVPQKITGDINVEWPEDLDAKGLHLSVIVRCGDVYFTSSSPDYVEQEHQASATRLETRLKGLRGIPAGDRYLIVRTDGYAGCLLDLQSKNDTTLEVSKHQAGRISGTASSGQIQLQLPSDELRSLGIVKTLVGDHIYGTPGLVASATVNDNGTFRFPAVAPGRYMLVADSSQDPGGKRVSKVTVESGKETKVNLSPKRATSPRPQ